MKTSILRTKSFEFAVRIIRLVQWLQKVKKEFVMSGQLARCGVSVGSLIREGEFAQSKKDFINKMSISLKEDNESDYLILLLSATEFIDQKQFEEVHPLCLEIKAMLISSIKTAKSNLSKEKRTKTT